MSPCSRASPTTLTRLAERIVAYADLLALEPVDGSVQTVKTRFVVHAGVAGRLADAAVPVEAAFADVGELDAPASLTYALPVRAVEPEITTAEASTAKATAERIAAEVTLSAKTGKQKITQSRLRSWITFAPTADGGYAPTMDTAGLPDVLKKLAKKINQAPINASFKTSGGRITGVTASKTGYKMDVEATQKQVLALIAARLEGGTGKSIEPTAKVTQPALTTAEAKAARPKMRKISQWTTPFPISDRNGFGANIWIPARLINGYVVAPRATFDFWDAVGPVTRAKGYKSGGAIINGRTEPQGALAGGICSCSTTLFNAALRAGYEMGARRNHYYYIDRYPIGLDATVFISASGSKRRSPSRTTRTTRCSSAGMASGRAGPATCGSRCTASRPAGTWTSTWVGSRTSAMPPTRSSTRRASRPARASASSIRSTASRSPRRASSATGMAP